MNTPSVSIIISFFSTERMNLFSRTLAAFSHLNYSGSIEFVLIDDAVEDKDRSKLLVDTFTKENPDYKVKYLRVEPKGANTNELWNRGFQESTGEFVLYAMQDIIPSTKDIVQVMLNHYQGRRVSVVPYQLSKSMTDILDTVDWQNNPRLIETLPGFWTDTSTVNPTRVAANLLCHLTGQHRQDWLDFGLFRTDKIGYLWIDQDIAIREQFLKLEAVSVPPAEACCYHQYHDKHTLVLSPYHYVYQNERQARLQEPALKVEP